MRLAHPKTRLEAITSRPKLLSAVGRMTPPRRPEQDLADHHARSGGTDQEAHRQCPRRSETCSSKRAAVGKSAALVRLGALHHRANTGLSAQAKPRTNRIGDWLTEENRMKNLAASREVSTPNSPAADLQSALRRKRRGIDPMRLNSALCEISRESLAVPRSRVTGVNGEWYRRRKACVGWAECRVPGSRPPRRRWSRRRCRARSRPKVV